MVEDPALLSDKQREDLGITKRLPTSLNQSLDMLRSNQELRQNLGSDLVDNFLMTKETEINLVKGKGSDWYRQWY